MEIASLGISVNSEIDILSSLKSDCLYITRLGLRLCSWAVAYFGHGRMVGNGQCWLSRRERH